MSKPSLLAIPLGGLGEFGMNMLVLRTGDDMILIDAGMMFPEVELLGVDIVQGYRRESWEKVLGGQVTLVCRGHIHYGGVVGDQEHDTWFCFSFSTHRHAFSAEGLPPEYNRYT